MIQNELLMEKYNVQKKMALEASYDITKLAKTVHCKMKETEQKYKLKFQYATLDYVKPILDIGVKNMIK